MYDILPDILLNCTIIFSTLFCICFEDIISTKCIMNTIMLAVILEQYRIMPRKLTGYRSYYHCIGIISSVAQNFSYDNLSRVTPTLKLCLAEQGRNAGSKDAGSRPLR